MNYEEELAAKKAARKAAIEKDKREAKTIWRYLQFYGTVIFVLSFYSYLLDIIFYSIDYGSPDLYYYPVQYIGYYVLAGYMVFPISLLYNYLINHSLPKNNEARLLAGIIGFTMVGWLLTIDFKFGYYIGEYRPLKNIIVIFLSGATVELLRILIVKRRLKKKSF